MFREARGNCSQLCLRPFDRDASLQTRHREEVMFTAHRAFDRFPYERRPQRCKRRHCKCRRHHADDRVRTVVQFNILSDDARIGAELRGPQLMRKHDFILTLALIIARHDRPAEQRFYAERRKKCRLHA